MKRLINERDSIQSLLDEEWAKFKNAIDKGAPFEEAKIIYLRIKELQSQLTSLTEKIPSKLNSREVSNG